MYLLMHKMEAINRINFHTPLYSNNRLVCILLRLIKLSNYLTECWNES